MEEEQVMEDVANLPDGGVAINESVSEKMLPQSEVDRRIGAAKLKEREKIMREMESARASEQAAPQQGADSDPRYIDAGKIKDDIRSELQAERERERTEYEEQMRKEKAQEFVDAYNSKLASGKEAYEDFDDVVAKVDPRQFVKVIMLANDVDGTADVMYELARNPDKLARLDYMANKSEGYARQMMQELSDSLRLNKEAVAKQSDIKQPISKLKSSLNGTNNSKEPSTIADFKRQPWLQTRR